MSKVYVEKTYDSEKPYMIFRITNNDVRVITKCNYKQNAELIAKILNDDINGVSSVVKAWEQYRGVDVI